MIDYYHPRINLIFTGSGFLGSYYLGSVALLQQIWPQKPYNKVSGASCGGIIAVALASGMKVIDICKFGLDLIEATRNVLKNPLQGKNLTSILDEILEICLPNDCHLLCNDKLMLSVTELWTFKNRLITQYKTRKDVKTSMLATSFLPIWSGFNPPIIDGVRCIDGAYSNNAPKFELNENENELGIRHITIAPFACDHHVTPKDNFYLFSYYFMGARYAANWQNIKRCWLAMIPPSVQEQKQATIDGYNHMKEYLLHNNFIKCQICYKANPNLSSANVKDPGNACISCLKLMEKVDSIQIPESMLSLYDVYDK